MANQTTPKDVAIVLAGGSGSRMQSDVPKQFLPLGGKPVITYALSAFENSAVDEIVLVSSAEGLDRCRDIVAQYHFRKVTHIISGGAERYDSVYAALRRITQADYVYVQDGARPFVTPELIAGMREAVRSEKAVVAAMPVKDTIKVADALGYAVNTPDRSTLWQIQTPQVFAWDLLWDAYTRMMQVEHADVTDDAMVVERYTDQRVKLYPAFYRNIKITTPEDLIVAESYLKM